MVCKRRSFPELEKNRYSTKHWPTFTLVFIFKIWALSSTISQQIFIKPWNYLLCQARWVTQKRWKVRVQTPLSRKLQPAWVHKPYPCVKEVVSGTKHKRLPPHDGMWERLLPQNCRDTQIQWYTEGSLQEHVCWTDSFSLPPRRKSRAEQCQSQSSRQLQGGGYQQLMLLRDFDKKEVTTDLLENCFWSVMKIKVG